MSWIQDVRVSLRGYLKTPGFTLAALACLVLGIGATSAVYSVVQGVLLTPLPYPQGERLVMLWNEFAANDQPKLAVSGAEFVDYRDRSTSFESVAAVIPHVLNLFGKGDPERFVTARVSASLWPMLGVQPVVGRVFGPEEDVFGQGQVVLLSHGLWQRRFGGDEAVIDSTLVLNGQPYQVIGVLPPDLDFDIGVYEMWIPIALNDALLPARRQMRGIRVYGRLADGVDLAEAQADMDRVAGLLTAQFPDAYPRESGFGVTVSPLFEEIVGDVRPALWILLGTVALVLLIACANVANLLLARALSRRREVALYRALGASRGALWRRQLIDGLVLGLVSAPLGLLLAWGLVKAAIALDPGVPRLDEVTVNPQVAILTAVVSLLVGLAVCVLPLFLRQAALSETLKAGGDGRTASGRSRTRDLLVVAEVALALMVVVASGLTLRSFLRLTQVDPGFRAENVLTLQLFLPPFKYPQSHLAAGFIERAVEQVNALPGVEGAGVTSTLPLSGFQRHGDLEIEHLTLSEGEAKPAAEWFMVTPGYLESVGVRLVDGRTFEPSDHGEAPGVAVVDDRLARRWWPGEEVLGRRVRLETGRPDEPWRTIVGVVEPVRSQALDTEPGEQIYVPFAQHTMPMVYLTARTAGSAEEASGAVRGALARVDPTQPILAVSTLDKALEAELAQPRFRTALLGGFALLALLLAGLGVYAVVAYSVAWRTQEIGVRMALGANRGTVVGQVIRESMWVIGVGVLVGIGLALAFGKFLSGVLYDLAPTDPATLAGVTLVLLGSALLASWLPALRATRIDPAVALRNDR